jgi:hypothetical protein
MKNPANNKNRNRNPMMQNALRLCERMASSVIEFRLIVRLPVLVEEFTHPHRALRHVDQVRIILDIDPELLDHAWLSLHRVILAAVDEASRNFVEGLDRDGWVQVLELALEIDDPAGSSNVVRLGDYQRSARDGSVRDRE